MLWWCVFKQVDCQPVLITLNQTSTISFWTQIYLTIGLQIYINTRVVWKELVWTTPKICVHQPKNPNWNNIQYTKLPKNMFMLHGAETEGYPELAYACPWLYSSESTYQKNWWLPTTNLRFQTTHHHLPKKDVSFQTRPPEFQPHTHVHAYHEGSGFKNPSLVLWLAMGGGNLGFRPRRFSPSGFFLGFIFLWRLVLADQSPPLP